MIWKLNDELTQQSAREQEHLEEIADSIREWTDILGHVDMRNFIT